MSVLAPLPVNPLVQLPPNQDNVNLLFDYVAFFVDRYISQWDAAFQRLHRELIPPTLSLPIIEALFERLISEFNENASLLTLELERIAAINSRFSVGWFLSQVEKNTISFMEDFASSFDDEYTHAALSIFFEYISEEGDELLVEISELIEDSLAPRPGSERPTMLPPG